MNYDPRKAIRQAMMIARQQVTAPNKTAIGGQRHMLAYITPYEAELLMRRGGSGRMTQYGVPAFDDGDGGGGGGDAANSEASTQDAAGGNAGEGAGPTGAGAGATGETGPDDTDASVGANPTAVSTPTAPTATAPFGTQGFGQAPSALGMGVVGGLAGAAMGVPGLGAIGTAIGTGLDVEGLNSQLGMMGLPENISYEQALAHNMSLGAFGKSATDQFGQTLGFDALAEAPMSAFSAPQGLPDPVADVSGDMPGYYIKPAQQAAVGQGYADGGAVDPFLSNAVPVEGPNGPTYTTQADLDERIQQAALGQGYADGGDVKHTKKISVIHATPNTFDEFKTPRERGSKSSSPEANWLWFGEHDDADELTDMFGHRVAEASINIKPHFVNYGDYDKDSIYDPQIMKKILNDHKDKKAIEINGISLKEFGEPKTIYAVQDSSVLSRPQWRKDWDIPVESGADVSDLPRYADGGQVPQMNVGDDPTVQRALDLTRQNEVSPMEAARSVASGETYAGKDAPAYSQAGPEAGGVPIGGSVSGSAGRLSASHQAPLEGLPTRIKVPLTGEVITAGPNHQVRAVAEQYMRDAGLPYNPPTKYAKVDAARAKRIADEYERMADDPSHPLVKAAYDAMIKETMAQYQAAKAAGFKAEFWDPEKERDPYEASPRLAIEDVNKNHHMYVFPTYFGYGSKEVPAEEAQKNPLLADSGERWNGYPVTVNDIFRAVHDYFGHAKEGVGFRHDGEENAWRSHASMYSPLARLAMTSETRGQNSWLNFGPHGDANKKARTEDTIFADQKIGVMAPWTTHEGAEDFLRPEDREAMEKAYKQYRRAYGGRLGYADGGMMGDDPMVQRALDITRGAQPAAPDMARQVQPMAMPAVDQSSPIDQYRGTGLSFPDKDNVARLALKAKRENLLAQGKAAGNPANPRMVIRAPKSSDGEKQLPDFVVGQLNHNDWIDRHETILSPSEIHQASQWYKRVKGTFDTFYPNDPELSKTMMRAWLVAQQNVSPAGAMNNVLMQREQMLRGDPEETWQAGGMPMPTQAARSVLRQQPIEMGVGQKIADFVDSAEGKPVRSWMGNHPDGGAPFVVDVHTARDTGMVDEELLNHLRRLGYNQDDLSKVKIDLKGSPTEASYENRAQWGRGLTKYLNGINWQGKSNWTPEEIQAVGWMGMTKLTRNAEEDSESGLNRNLRRLSFETAPGEGSPWEKKYGQAFANLSSEQQRMVTHAINEEALQHVAKLSGIDVRHVVHGTGAWENQQSPASVAQALMTQKGGDISANALGYLLNQTEVWHNRVKPLGGTKNPAGFAVDFIQKNGHELADPAYLQDFWQKITEADPHNIIKGYQPIRLPTGEVGIRAIVTKGGEKTKGLIESLVGQDGPIRKVIEESPHDLEVMGHEAEVTRAVNDWKENPNGEAYMERLVNLLGPDSRAKLAAIRSQLEKKLEAYLADNGGGEAQQIKKSTGRQKAQLDKAGGGFISKDPELLERALRLTATNRPMVALADLFQRQLRGRPPS